MEDYQKKRFSVYFRRGETKQKLGDYQGAVDDYSKGLLDPDTRKYGYVAYLRRALAKEKLLDYQGAFNDYTKVIKIKPRLSTAYFKRAHLRGITLLDFKGACIDWKRASKLGNMDANQLLKKYCE